MDACAECGCTLKGASTTIPRVCDVCRAAKASGGIVKYETCTECGFEHDRPTDTPRKCASCEQFYRGFDNGHEEGRKAALKEIAATLPSPTLTPEVMEAIKERAVASEAASYRLHHVTCRGLYFGDGACNCGANEHNVMVSMYAQVQQDARYLLAEIERLTERLTKGLDIAA